MSILRPSQLFTITAFFFCVWIGNSVPCSADQESIPPAKAIEFEGDLALTPKPLTLKGYLRRRDGSVVNSDWRTRCVYAGLPRHGGWSGRRFWHVPDPR